MPRPGQKLELLTGLRKAGIEQRAEPSSALSVPTIVNDEIILRVGSQPFAKIEMGRKGFKIPLNNRKWQTLSTERCIKASPGCTPKPHRPFFKDARGRRLRGNLPRFGRQGKSRRD